MRSKTFSIIISKTFLIIIAILGLAFLYTEFDLLWTRRQLSDHLEHKIQLQKENETIKNRIRSYQENLPSSPDKPIDEQIKEEIRRQAEARGIDPELAVKIAECESHFNPFAKNPKSSAYGIYQFLEGTWANYCVGERENWKDNIKCFMVQWPQNPGWWKPVWSCAGYNN